MADDTSKKIDLFADTLQVNETKTIKLTETNLTSLSIMVPLLDTKVEDIANIFISRGIRHWIENRVKDGDMHKDEAIIYTIICDQQGKGLQESIESLRKNRPKKEPNKNEPEKPIDEEPPNGTKH